MLTRMAIARLMPTARRILGGNTWKTHARLHAAVLVSLALSAAALADDAEPGVVRVSDHVVPAANFSGDASPKAMPVPAAPAPANAPTAAAPSATGPVAVGVGGNTCDSGACGTCGHDGRCGEDCRRGIFGRCCLCREGCGWRFLDAHCYSMTYAVNPWYADGRDGRVYAAYGYGAPMTVPLAPTVTNQYNYGWGIPSGRLTPISRVAPMPGALNTAVAPY